MNIFEMREESTRIANQARALLDTITPENRSDKEAEFDRMMAESDSYADRANRAERSEARGREFDSIATEVVSETIEARSGSNEVEQRSAARRDYILGNISETELRAQSVGTTTAGGYTVADAPMAALVETLKAYGPMLDGSLVNLITTSGGNPLPIPTVNETAKHPTAVTAENAEITATDAVFGQKVLGAYKFTSLVTVSSEFLADSSIDPETYIVRALGERLARGVNPFLTVGTGTAQPAGVVTGSSLGKTAADDVTITADEIIDLFYSLDGAYRGMASWMFNDATVALIRKFKDSTGQYIWQPSYVVGTPDTIMGRPVLTNNSMDTIAAAKKIGLFGDFKRYTVRLAGGVQIKRLNERYADTDQVGFLATMRVDGVNTDGAAIKHLITAAS